MTELLVQRPSEGVVLATLNRPERLNAVTMDLQARLDDLLTELENDGETRCLVLTGAGDRAFSAGYDVHEMADWTQDELVLSLVERERWIAHFAQTPLPVVCALNGITYGVGAILATAADIRYGSDETVFRFTAGAHGGANATWTLPALVGRGMASEFLLAARKIAAGEALAAGLLNRVVAPDDLLDEACGIAAQIAANPPAGSRAIKRLIREHAGRGVMEQLEAENLAMRTELRPRPIKELYQGFIKP